MNMVSIPRELLEDFLEMFGHPKLEHDANYDCSDELRRRLEVSRNGMRNRISNTTMTLCHSVPLHKLSANIDNLIANLVGEYVQLETADKKHCWALREIAAQTMPPGTYLNIEDEPEKLIKAVTAIVAELLASLKQIPTSMEIEHEQN